MTFIPARPVRSLALSLCTVAGLCATAGAQHFNLDFDDPFGVGATCASTYAAAGTAGTWNSIDAGVGPTFNLVDKSGAATGVTFDTGPQMIFPFSFANAAFGGEDGNLMQDLVWSGGALGGTMTFTGLANGDYTVLTYAMAPDSKAGGLTDVSSPQSLDGVQTIGGALWTGAHVEGATYAKHHVTVTTGTLDLVIVFVAFGESVNGIQIEAAQPIDSGASDCDCSSGVSPCFTGSAPGRGCPNSNPNGLGAQLTGAGNPTVSNDSFSLSVTDAAPSKPGLILAGTASLGPNGLGTVPDSAGLLCVSGMTRRGAVVSTDPSGAASFPDFQGAAYGASDIVTVGMPVSYTYWFRDPGTAAGCTGDTASSDFNFSNGWTVMWQ